MIDLTAVRAEFPSLERTGPSGAPLVYLDNAATTLKPRAVIDRVAHVMAQQSAALHRSVHFLGDEATAVYEESRQRVAWHLGAEAHEIVFVRNTTEALNRIALGMPGLRRVVVSLTDHHSSLLPWRGEVIRLEPDERGTLDLNALDRTLARGDVDLVCLSHVSNVTGMEIDARAIADRVHAAGALFALDAAQSAPHRALDVVDLDCDFLAFSAHKMCGPTGVGALFGKSDCLDRLEPALRGGGMVDTVRNDGYDLMAVPWRFEAGTPTPEAAAGFAAALDLLDGLGLENIEAHQRAMTEYAVRRVQADLPHYGILGPAEARVGPICLRVPGESPHQIARMLSDNHGICVRSGFHCAEPLHRHLGATATLRISPYLYNSTADIDRFVDGMMQLGALGL